MEADRQVSPGQKVTDEVEKVAPSRKIDQVAIADWTLNGVSPDWSQPLTLKQDTLYDLRVVVTLTGAPREATRLQLLPRSVERPGVVDAPEFCIDLPSTWSRASSVELHAQGRLLPRSSTSLGARPIELAYEAIFDADAAPDFRAPILVFEVTSDGSPTTTGYREGDQKLQELRNWIRTTIAPTANEHHTRDFLLLASKIISYAGACLQGHSFKTKVGEAEFQRQTLIQLRSSAGLGSEVLEAPKSAGGITDITFRDIPIELKVNDHKSFVVSDAEKFAKQDLQYAAGNNSRFGVVAVLDVSEKTDPPSGLAGDITYMLRQDNPTRVILLVVIRGCLPQPSSHSS